jgi:hypothetical protein
MLITVSVMACIISKQRKMDYINRVSLQAGIGELSKSETPPATVMPSEYDIAETHKPIRFTLISKGAKIRIHSDGWPTIVFSGWSDMS